MVLILSSLCLLSIFLPRVASLAALRSMGTYKIVRGDSLRDARNV